ncbi:hypothetical protein TCAP_02875 [Tolypocladium capitatum]|uniref:Uncharacterized protein n=1 Tax=Tolypocladium capitatum TaxID=45235 RepID=A0A2K3QI25_9HYPO|nr:hypothetical protein TCAP_02875 [Tolypocladium capitatum]
MRDVWVLDAAQPPSRSLRRRRLRHEVARPRSRARLGAPGNAGCPSPVARRPSPFAFAVLRRLCNLPGTRNRWRCCRVVARVSTAGGPEPIDCLLDRQPPAPHWPLFLCLPHSHPHSAIDSIRPGRQLGGARPAEITRASACPCATPSLMDPAGASPAFGINAHSVASSASGSAAGSVAGELPGAGGGAGVAPSIKRRAPIACKRSVQTLHGAVMSLGAC